MIRKILEKLNPSSFNLRMIVTTITFYLFIRLSSAQSWCPGSSVPAPCCSRLLDGSITPDYARSDVKLLKPMYGYQDVEGKISEHISISECYDKCKVGVCYISLPLPLNQYCFQGKPFVRSDCSFFFEKTSECYNFLFGQGYQSQEYLPIFQYHFWHMYLPCSARIS